MDETENPFDQEPYRSFADEYIKELLFNRRQIADHARRSLLLTVILAFLFLLARGSTRAAVTIFSLRVEDLHPILAAIPVATAFQFVNLMHLIVDAGLISDRLSEVLAATYPKLNTAYWRKPLWPVNDAVAGPVLLANANWMFRSRMWLTLMLPLVVSIAETWAYGAQVGFTAGSFLVVSPCIAALIAWGCLMIGYGAQSK